MYWTIFTNNPDDFHITTFSVGVNKILFKMTDDSWLFCPYQAYFIKVTILLSLIQIIWLLPVIFRTILLKTVSCRRFVWYNIPIFRCAFVTFVTQSRFPYVQTTNIMYIMRYCWRQLKISHNEGWHLRTFFSLRHLLLLHFPVSWQ